jgi:hypothetical protein
LVRTPWFVNACARGNWKADKLVGPTDICYAPERAPGARVLPGQVPQLARTASISLMALSTIAGALGMPARHASIASVYLFLLATIRASRRRRRSTVGELVRVALTRKMSGVLILYLGAEVNQKSAAHKSERKHNANSRSSRRAGVSHRQAHNACGWNDRNEHQNPANGR